MEEKKTEENYFFGNQLKAPVEDTNYLVHLAKQVVGRRVDLEKRARFPLGKGKDFVEKLRSMEGVNYDWNYSRIDNNHLFNAYRTGTVREVMTVLKNILDSREAEKEAKIFYKNFFGAA